MKLCASRKYFQNIHAKYYDLPLKNVEEDVTLSCAWQLRMRIVRFFCRVCVYKQSQFVGNCLYKIIF